MAFKAFKVWTKDKERGKLISADRLEEMLVKSISKKGPWETFTHCLGDFKQNVISSTMFCLSDYVKLHCLTTKPRVYLMSKPKEDTDDDWDLPDLDLDMSSPESVSLLQERL
ncbi:uncharacterized protein LOC117343832 [Pecten maximus]|uniref:uncharacterized protein LOC117343832 n=1 Tax=Pecten maximus TaxID=6579 RepID=UPI00145909E6|nr:uncharacterized protein LOC117343832 [Pecten maximus]